MRTLLELPAGSVEDRVALGLGHAILRLLDVVRQDPGEASFEAMAATLVEEARRTVGVWRAGSRPDPEVERRLIDSVEMVVAMGLLRGDARLATDRLVAAKAQALDALAQVARHVESMDSMPAFFGKVTATVAGMVSARGVLFWRLSPDSRTLTPVREGFGVALTETSAPRPVPVREGARRAVDRLVFLGKVLRSRIDEDAGAGGAERRLGVGGAHEVVAVPWRRGDGPLGVLAAYDSTRAGGFTDEDTWVLLLASQAAGLVWQLKDAETRISEMSDQEKRLLQDHVNRVAALEEVKSDFLKLASHELRTPLAVIRGYLDMLADGSIDPAAFAARLPVIQGRVEQMSRLIGSMLETARLEEDQLGLELGEHDLRTILGRALEMVRPLLQPGHRLRVRRPRAALTVRVDAERIETILVNLLDNAIKYSPGGGAIDVRLHRSRGMARLLVSDAGLGIRKEDLDRLFTRFGRLVTPDNSHISGTGLGLYVSQQLAERHGGRISVRSRPGYGSRFQLQLPLSPTTVP